MTVQTISLFGTVSYTNNRNTAYTNDYSSIWAIKNAVFKLQTGDPNNVYNTATNTDPNSFGGTSLSNLANFDPKKKTIFLTHGWGSTPNLAFYNAASKQHLEDQLQALNPGANIIDVDWRLVAGYWDSSNATYGKYSQGPLNYSNTAARVGDVAQALANAMQQLGIDPNNTEIVGHSLGAHVAGLAGLDYKNATGKLIQEVVGLDPAGPNFSLNNGLNPQDAQRVVAIHSSSAILGPLSAVDTKSLGYVVREPSTNEGNLDIFLQTGGSIYGSGYTGTYSDHSLAITAYENLVSGSVYQGLDITTHYVNYDSYGIPTQRPLVPSNSTNFFSLTQLDNLNITGQYTINLDSSNTARTFNPLIVPGWLGGFDTTQTFFTIDAFQHGLDDLVQIWNNNGTAIASVRKNDGNGKFGAYSGETQSNIGGFAGVKKFLAMDANNDKKTDIVELWNNGTAQAAVYQNNGDGTFTALKNTSLGFAFNNQDQFLSVDNSIVKIHDNGNGTVSANTWSLNDSLHPGALTNYLGGSGGGRQYVPLDANADGKTDILEIGGNNWTSVWANNGDGTFGYLNGGWSLGGGQPNSHYVALDINRDGKTDLVQTYDRGDGNAAATVWLNNGNGTFNQGSNTSWLGGLTGFNSQYLALNQLGVPDILQVYGSGGSVHATIWA
ncbi:FG-GAP-like repeat-containing protein [Nostoc sp. TCL240-02]|uniref:FG-GAP-like repeat-containing protein n=1 Tax=Nostoc sp. TCL240-02 TaxID=2572090 RepID=UPI00157FAAE5|nr:FG-GAP-like repeat-containing protein [Nostoc sp. TCL240-02]